MKKYAKYKLNNDGAALVMAIVVIAFVSILTTVLLYLANMNYQMKATDYNTKDVFYEAEMPLEGIRALLVKDVAEAAAKAYDITVLNYANVDSDVRYTTYQSNFYQTIIDNWKNRCKNGAEWDWLHGLEYEGLSCSPVSVSDIHVIKGSAWSGLACNEANCPKTFHIILDESIADSDRLKVVEDPDDNTKNMLQLRGIKLIYTKGNFSAMIETNFNIVPPELNLEVDSYLDDAPAEAISRKDVKFEDCVTYIGYKKQ